MKITRLITPLLMTLITISAMAQESAKSSDPADVIVLEQSWRKEYRDSLHDPNPLKPNEDLMRITRAQKAHIKAQDTALPDQTTTPNMPAAGPKPVTPERGMFTSYIYKIKVKNSGEKMIKALDWEYQFLDPSTQEVVEQRKIISRLRLSPGKSQVLERRMTRKPTVVVSADQLGRETKDQFTERAVITRIVYADGSVWLRPKTE
jgi:hypothetical protein